MNIKIAKGIESADPINADTSKALDVNIFLVGSDDEDLPTIYSIRRADNPLLPATADTVQVIVTLSEMAKEFKKGNLVITDNATISKEPEALDPVAEDPGRFRTLSVALGRTSTAAAPDLRGLYDGTNRAGTVVADLTGIHAAINTDTEEDSPSDAAEALSDALAGL